MPTQLLNSVHIRGVDGSFGEDLDPGGTDRSQPVSLRGSWPLEHVQHYLHLPEVSRGHWAKGCSLEYCWSDSGTRLQSGLLRNPGAGPDGCSGREAFMSVSRAESGF